MNLKCLAAALLAAHALLCAARAGDYVTKEEFNRFLEQYQKNEAENKELKKKNEELALQVQALQAESKEAKLESRIDSLLPPNEVTDKRSYDHDLDDPSRSGTTKFLMAGWGDSGYEDRQGKNTTFTASFHPVFLWKFDDHLSFESDLTYEVISYHFSDLGTFEAGKFLTPFGAFIRRQHQTWSNKLPDDPLALDINTGLVPSYSVGAMFSGGFDAPCSTRFNYAAYVSNGPKLSAANPATYGQLDFNNDSDTNKSKAFGGRVGFLPTADLEFAASFQASRVGQNGTPQSATDSLLLGADASYVHDFDTLKGTIDIKGEWIWSRVDDAVYNFGGTNFQFNGDRRNGGYAQIAYRPGKVNQKWVRNLEFVLRFDRLDNPNHGPLVPGADRSQFADHDRGTFGVDYWLGPTAVLKFAYEKDRNKDRAFLLQFALGF